MLSLLFIAAKAEPISVIWREYLKNAQYSFRKLDSTPIHVTCKFARRYGKDCESEVHEISISECLLLFQKRRSLTFQDMLEQFKTVYWWNLDSQQEDKKIISLILFAVLPDHRISLTDPLPALVPELTWLMSMAMDNISKDFDFQSVTEPKKDIKLLYLKVGR